MNSLVFLCVGYRYFSAFQKQHKYLQFKISHHASKIVKWKLDYTFEHYVCCLGTPRNNIILTLSYWQIVTLIVPDNFMPCNINTDLFNLLIRWLKCCFNWCSLLHQRRRSVPYWQQHYLFSLTLVHKYKREILHIQMLQKDQVILSTVAAITSAP